MAGEADFEADLRVGFDDPGVGRVGQDFTSNESFDATFLEQRDLLEVAQFAVGLVFEEAGLAGDGGFVKAVQRDWSDPSDQSDRSFSNAGRALTQFSKKSSPSSS